MTISEKTIEAKETYSLEAFSPIPKVKAELITKAEASKDLVITDIHDNSQIEEVKRARITLRDTRNDIVKKAKAMREDAKDFQKKVISIEKELVSIITPEEERLAEEETKAKEALEREKKEKLLPERRAKADEIGIEVSDDQLLNMEATAFGFFIQKEKLRIEQEEFERKKKEEQEEAERKQREEQEKFEAEKRKQEEAQKALEEEKRKFEEEKRIREAETKAREEEVERTKLALEQAEEDKKRAVEEAEQKAKELIQKEKEVEEARVKKEEEDKKTEQEKLEKQKAYKTFLKKNDYYENEELFFCSKDDSNNSIKLYKLVDTFTFKK